MGKKGLSVKKLCEEVGITRAGLIKGWKTETIGFRHIKKIAQLLEIDQHDTMFGSENSEALTQNESMDKEINQIWTLFHQNTEEIKQLKEQVERLTKLIEKHIEPISKQKQTKLSENQIDIKRSNHERSHGAANEAQLKRPGL